MRTKAIRGWGLFLALVGITMAGLLAWAQVPPPPGHVALWIVEDGAGTVTPDPVGIDAVGAFWYPPGTEVTLTAEADPGFWITGWTIEERPVGEVDWVVVDEIPVDPPTDGDVITVTMQEDVDLRVTAHFQRFWTLTVGVDPVDTAEFFDHGDVSVDGDIPGAYPATYQFLDRTVVDLEAVPNETWDFVEWTGDLAGDDPTQELLMDGDKQVIAHFDYHLYTLEIHVDGCGDVEVNGVAPADYPATSTYHYMEIVGLEAFPCVGWHFSGWSTDLEGEDNPTTITMDSDKTVVASFSRDQYTLTVDIVGQGSVTVDPDQPTYLYGDVVDLHAEAAIGWYFDHWEGDLTGTDPDTSITMDGHKNVTAVFLPYEYTLTINIEGQGIVQKFPDQATYHYGDVVQLTAVPDDCWQFVGWSGAITGAANPATVTITGDTTVTATFEKIIYTLNVDVDPAGAGVVEVSPDDLDPGTPGYQFYCGTEVTLEAQNLLGGCYYFTHWSGGIDGSDSTVTFVMDGDKDVTAHYTKFQYTLTVDVDPAVGGDIKVNGVIPGTYPATFTFDCGDTVALQALPDPCYEFTGWSGDATGGAVTMDVYMDGPKTVTANFELLYYTLTVDVVGEGDVAVDGVIPGGYPAEFTYPCSSLVDLDPMPAPGWAFDHWAGPVAGGQVHIDTNVSVTAVFVPACVTRTKTLPGGWNLVSIPVRPGCDDGGCPPSCWEDGQAVVMAEGSAAEGATFGVDPDATDGFDPGLDAPHPPPGFPPYTYAYFILAGEWYTTDIKAPIGCAESKTWTLEVVDNGPAGQVTLTWDPADFATATECLQSVVLIDMATGAQVNMLAQNTYTYTKAGNPDTREFTITVTCYCAAGGEVFADDISPLYLYQWDACGPGYNGPADEELVPEEGVWLWVPDGGATVDVTGYLVDTDVTLALPCAGWHQISAPWDFPRCQIRFTDGATTKTWDEALAAGWIANALWGYDPTDGYFDATQLDPWNGYWLYTFQDGLTMILLYEYAGTTDCPVGTLSVLSRLDTLTPPPPPAAPMAGLSFDVVNEPNPVRDVHTTTFRVVGPLAALVDAMRVRIFDQEGRLVYEAEVAGTELTWHTENLAGEFLANGVYLYRVEVKVAGQWIATQVKKLAIYR